MEVIAMQLVIEREHSQKRRWGQIVARAWDDDAFRRRLLAAPASVLHEAGIEMAPEATVQVIEGDISEAAEEPNCFWLPPAPAAGDLIEDDLSLPLDTPIRAAGPSRHCHCGRSHGPKPVKP
jgi:hypothetical protein